VSSRTVVARAVLALPLALPLALSSFAGPAQAQAEVYRCDGQIATIVGTRAWEDIHGTAGPDVIVGLGGRDTIDGGAGNDLICGGAARDRIDGGPGNDRIHGNQSIDELRGGDGDDHLFGNRGIQTVFYADQGDDHLASRSGDDRLDFRNSPTGVSVDLATGTATGWGTDIFHIGSVRVVLVGSLHDDTLLGTSRDEIIDGVQGEDTIDGREGDDLLSATEGSIAGGAGDDSLFGSGAAGVLDLDGGAGNDALDSHHPGHLLGGPGDDQLSWETDGPTPLVAGLVLDGGQGTDLLGLWQGITIDMSAGSMTSGSVTATAANFEDFLGSITLDPETSYDITGTDGPNSIMVGGNGSTIHSLGGDDVILGDDGDDLIDGGPGDDTADGQGGTDTCVSLEHPSNCEVVNP
jgi:Ca2+-binding RTX toxin-like protein